ncbi:hypothetical protein ABT112_00760 [Streptomyces sp. NPDC002055]|uniref:hypothetical protein n=1 Tax=Streptomyces sp. NPDC002055 TaxID=3154534 RepID=UPI0033252354
MGAVVRRCVGVALLGVVAVGGSAVGAAAEDGGRGEGRGTLSVSPRFPAPGGEVTLVQRGGCRERSVVASSEGFVRSVTLRDKGGSNFVGTARVSPRARVGETYHVRTRCERGGSSAEASFTVRRGATGGSDAGEGGSIAGVNGMGIAGGAALLVAGGAATVLITRKRNRNGA